MKYDSDKSRGTSTATTKATFKNIPLQKLELTIQLAIEILISHSYRQVIV